MPGDGSRNHNALSTNKLPERFVLKDPVAVSDAVKDDIITAKTDPTTSSNITHGRSTPEKAGQASVPEKIVLDVSESTKKTTTGSSHASPTRSTTQSSKPADRIVSGPGHVSRSCTSTFRYHPWAWEILCLFVGVVCMAAVLITLASIDGKALSAWSLPIQPNSMISVFMAVAKSALLVPVAECISQSKWVQFHTSKLPLNRFQWLDEASRGPWGSFQLLLRFKQCGRIAIFASILTICVLALDPFVQQILAFPSRIVPLSNATATFPTTRSLSNVNMFSLRGAILDGVYLAETPSIAYTCTTSACDWNSRIATLGICSQCRNITSIIEVTCEERPGPLRPRNNETWEFSTTNCTYQVMDNIAFSAYIQTLSIPAVNGRKAEYANEFTKAKMIVPPRELKLGDLLSPSTDWLVSTIIYTSYFDESLPDMPKLTLENLRPEINVCGFYWCSQVFDKPRVRNGTLQTTDPSSTYRLQALVHPQGSADYVQTTEGRIAIYEIPPEQKSEFPMSPYYGISNEIRSSFKAFLRDLFDALHVAGNDKFYVFPEQSHGTPGLLDAAAQDRNISASFVRMSRSATEQIRASNNATFVPGLALGNKTFMAVRWGWLALPLIMFVSALTLLIKTMITSSKRNVTIWKSSTLAVLLHDIKSGIVEEQDMQSLLAMERLAAKVNVTIQDRHFVDLA
ncbi:hypothetical protein HJFPF1_10274 [Paramyrothecium foliicola]|nr:hypothetical protein HJFPF1_10274 [Paramyrothecium foliicola]